MRELATPDEVAAYLRVQPQTLRLWASQNRGPAYVMVEGARRYRWPDVEQYLAERTVDHR